MNEYARRAAWFFFLLLIVFAVGIGFYMAWNAIVNYWPWGLVAVCIVPPGIVSMFVLLRLDPRSLFDIF